MKAKCPYCNKEQEINHDDGYGYEEDVLYSQECYGCEKTFTYYTSVTFNYEEFKADCLNDGKHEWEPTLTIPIKYTKMQCKTCDTMRPCTDAELARVVKNLRSK